MTTQPKQTHSAEDSGSQNKVLKFLTRASIRAGLPYAIVSLLLIICVIAGGREIAHHIDAIESWITKLGPWGIIAFVGLFVVATSCLLPDTVLCIIAGALFGLSWGFVAVLVGSLMAATLQYALSRKILHTRIQRTLAEKPSLIAIQHAVIHDEFRMQVLIRLTPLNPATITYLLGAAGVRFAGFIAASLALIPNLFIEVYFGHVGKHVTRVTTSASGTLHLHEFVLISGLIVCIVVMVYVSQTARKAVAQAVADTQTEDKTV